MKLSFKVFILEKPENCQGGQVVAGQMQLPKSQTLLKMEEEVLFKHPFNAGIKWAKLLWLLPIWLIDSGQTLPVVKLPLERERSTEQSLLGQVGLTSQQLGCFHQAVYTLPPRCKGHCYRSYSNLHPLPPRDCAPAMMAAGDLYGWLEMTLLTLKLFNFLKSD